jgi:hypothetical protein
MEKYTNRDYAASAETLRSLATGGPESAAPRFYLAIDDLVTGNPSEADAQLRAVESMGETPYLEEARFFRAKALLATRDVPDATRELEETVALKGDRETEARRILEQLRRLPVSR